jgi:hypothetical protein
MTVFDLLYRSVVIGAAATALLDLWALLLNRLFGFGLPNWAMVGRWVGHLARGRLMHDDIAQAAPVAGERAVGWVFHYAVGIAFALATLLLGGVGWSGNPTLLPPLVVGLATVGCGWFILQPGLGNGIAAARKPDAVRIRVLNIVGHTVFGLSMWFAALVIA